MATRAPRGEIVRNRRRAGGFTYALRFSAHGKRHYVTLGRPEQGWTDKRAEEELANTLAAVRTGTWRPWEPSPEPVPGPTFHEFASAWFDQVKAELRPNTVLDYEWQLVVHLLPFFKDHLLSQITVAEVDRYREHKVAENRRIEAAAKRGKPRMIKYEDRRGRKHERTERTLSAVSVNKTITRLGQILEVAVERELISRNPAKVGGRRRKLKVSKPERTYLDRAEWITALLDAAGAMDREAKSNGQIPRRAMLATLVYAGLRISEALELRWRDVGLAGGRLRVRKSKTDAGIAYVDLLPPLREELTTLKMSASDVERGTLLFPSAVGTRQDRNRVRTRVLAPAIERADKLLDAEGLARLPDGLTLHALRRTFASLLAILPGYDTPYIISQVRHTDPG
jgi:integrase